MIVLLLSIFTLLYCLVVIALIVGVVLAGRKDRPDASVRPFVSVVIPARNEEVTIAACLASIRDQSYPKELYEVILVDDNSTDRTGNIAVEMASQQSNMRVIVPKESSHLTGRSNALAQGIDTARGTVIMMTDADCVVPPTWVEHTARRFIKGVGVVGGMTVQRSSRWLEGMQSLDWTFLLGIAAATVGLRRPLSIIGNNFSISKEAYDDLGGFRSIKNSVTEDFQLFKSVVNTGRWEYTFMLDPATTNVTRPCPTVAEIIEQKHRWGRGGLDLNPLGYTLIITAFMTHLLIVLGLFTMSWGVGGWMALKTAGDFAFVALVANRVGRGGDVKYFLWFELYYLLYVVTMPLRVLSVREVVWKGRSYAE